MHGNAIKYMYMPDRISRQHDEKMPLLIYLNGHQKYVLRERKKKPKSLAPLVSEEIRGLDRSNPLFGHPQVEIRKRVKEVHSQEVSPCILCTHRKQLSTIEPGWRSLPREGQMSEL